jgi:hypothetical protein
MKDTLAGRGPVSTQTQRLASLSTPLLCRSAVTHASYGKVCFKEAFNFNTALLSGPKSFPSPYLHVIR